VTDGFREGGADSISDAAGGPGSRVASGAGADDASASKYAGCNGGGAAVPAGSGSFFLRRCKRSRIHLRMFRLVTQIAGPEQSGRPGYEPLVTAEGGTPWGQATIGEWQAPFRQRSEDTNMFP